MKPILISFSGIDGAGKSTQIQKLREYLSSYGIPVSELAFWDNVVVFPRLRAGFSRRVLQSDGRVGTPERPADRRDKNRQTLPLLLGRAVLHLVDALRLRRVVREAQSKHVGAIVFDRYIYDQLAALPLQNRMARAYARLVLAIAPDPDLAYLLDADPEKARARKPEYPLEFMRKYRSSYLVLRNMTSLHLVHAGEIAAVHQEIVEAFKNTVLTKVPGLQKTEPAAVA